MSKHRFALVTCVLLLYDFEFLRVGSVSIRGHSPANILGMPASVDPRGNLPSVQLSLSNLETWSRRREDLEDPEKTSQQLSVAKEMMAKAFDQIREQLKQNTITVAVVCVSLLLLAGWSLRGTGNLRGIASSSSLHREPFGRDQTADAPINPNDVKPLRLSMFSMAMLTCFKFWVGFLAATWMPFLMAKEGLAIWPEKQSVFMGAGKLIYGASIMLNPFFGLISDQTIVASRWSGRRLWLIIGVAISAMGVATVKAASSFQDPTSYLVATALWMLGEAIADTTVETLVPEMVPPEQYDVASGIRSLMFLCGGLCGYVSLIIFRDWDFHWLYPGYILLLLCCAFPTVACIREEEKSRSPVSPQKTFLDSLVEAYVGPMHKYGPGFARSCAIQFVFSLGIAPIFFSMLMVRDLCGVLEQTSQQTHFSAVSMLFMLAAAISSVVAANCRATQFHLSRKTLLLSSMVVFGLATLMLPTTYHFSGVTQRLCWFYFTGSLLGWAFGTVYALFQSCMWTLLPQNASDVANAMGFAALCKCVGVGLGNFAAGFILDSFSSGEQSYAIGGYWSMAVACSVLVLVSAALGQGVEGLD